MTLTLWLALLHVCTPKPHLHRRTFKGALARSLSFDSCSLLLLQDLARLAVYRCGLVTRYGAHITR